MSLLTSINQMFSIKRNAIFLLSLTCALVSTACDDQAPNAVSELGGSVGGEGSGGEQALGGEDKGGDDKGGDDKGGEISAGATSGAEVLSGAESGSEVSGTEAGDTPPVIPEQACGAPVEGEASAEGVSLALAEGALSGSAFSAPLESLALLTTDGLTPLSEAELEADRPRWALGCVDVERITLSHQGWRPLGHALWVAPRPDEAREGRGEVAALRRPARLTFQLDRALPEGLTPHHVQLFAWRAPHEVSVEGVLMELEGKALTPQPLTNPRFELEGGRVALSVEEPGLYVLAYHPERLAPRPQRFTYRAIMGVSMGGGGAASIAALYPDRFDFVGAFGGPSDWVYLFDYSLRRLFGGFCEGLGVEEGLEGCRSERLADPLEHPSTFEALYYSGNGGIFDRSEYVKIFKDLSLTFGTPLSFNPESPYLPAGVPLSELERPARERCAPECRGFACPEPSAVEPWLRLEGVYDRAYNPEGLAPVITFCDGEDGLPRGVFDGEAQHHKPTEITLAVDFNDNGRRDEGEPVLRQSAEPFLDVGCDGLANEDEPGFHPTRNPDPSGDDFHWRLNPRGTERDALFQGAEGRVGLERLDAEALPLSEADRARLTAGLSHIKCAEGEPGEPWRDVGLDGVAQTPQLSEGGYDWGEGDGAFNYNPNLTRALSRNPAHNLYAHLRAGGELPRFWVDGGVRDIFNFALTSMYLLGRLQGELGAGSAPTRVFQGFRALSGSTDVIIPRATDARAIDEAGWHIFVRYGDLDATPAQIEAGDGEHVGSTTQILSRLNSFLWWASRGWPERAHHSGGLGEVPTPIFDKVSSEAFGGDYTFSVALPPGYNLPENAEARYPVVYFLHGYGQSHTDMLASNAAFYGMMSSGALQKMIFVYPDGSCEGKWVRGEGPGCSDGLDNNLDGLVDLDDPGCLTPDDDEAVCEEGTFYTKHVAWRGGEPGGRDYEGAFLDMMSHVDQHYRTLAPEVIEVSRPD